MTGEKQPPAYDGPPVDPEPRRPAPNYVVTPAPHRPPPVGWTQHQMSWGESLAARGGFKNAQVPPSRWAILVLLVAQIVTNSLPILKLSGAATEQGMSTLVLWSRPAYAWSFAFLTVAVVIFALSVFLPLSRRLRVGVLVGGFTGAAGLLSVLGFFDILLRTSGSKGTASLAVGPIVAVIVGAVTLLIGVLEFLQLPTVQHKRPHAGPMRYAVFFTPVAAAAAFSVIALDISFAGKPATIPVGLVAVNESSSVSTALTQYEQAGVAVDGWWSALTVWSFVLLVIAAVLALIMLCRRAPTRIPGGFAIGPLLGLAGLFAVMWFFIALGTLTSREIALASVTKLDAAQFSAHLSLGGYLILAVGAVLMSLSAFEVADALQTPRIAPRPRTKDRPPSR
ncbi:hypothetical protein CLV47_12221 [Antricoccus suffuscus]|uniref:Uncharacterized protein n=1 Tax=Antricoccus suffuscus TaxID=1629062 RepID=A0A2T0ZFW9_9ACTN|nr:hypothetical protein [Antricoccus suffuscus]PRZ35201.1 hypothetical protein CLV47_12221 [Antricoccus suffuscus]